MALNRKDLEENRRPLRNLNIKLLHILLLYIKGRKTWADCRPFKTTSGLKQHDLVQIKCAHWWCCRALQTLWIGDLDQKGLAGWLGDRHPGLLRCSGSLRSNGTILALSLGSESCCSWLWPLVSLRFCKPRLLWHGSSIFACQTGSDCLYYSLHVLCTWSVSLQILLPKFLITDWFFPLSPLFVRPWTPPPPPAPRNTHPIIQITFLQY